MEVSIPVDGYGSGIGQEEHSVYLIKGWCSEEGDQGAGLRRRGD